jgi:hypothetical protein
MIDNLPLPSNAWLPANLAFGWLAFDDPSATGNILNEFKRIYPEIDRLYRSIDTTISLEAFMGQYEAPTGIGALCDKWRVLTWIVDRTEVQVRAGRLPAYLESEHRIEKIRVPIAYFDEGLTIHTWSGRLQPSSNDLDAGLRAMKKLKASGSDSLIWFRRDDLDCLCKFAESGAVLPTVPFAKNQAVSRELPLWLTPMQSVAWVCMRNPGAIWRADLEAEYCPNLGLHEAPIEQYFPSGTGITTLTLAAWHGIHKDVGDWMAPPNDALAKLVDRLRTGELRSNGVDLDGKRVEIDASEWRLMTLSEGDDPRSLVPSRPRPQYGHIDRWRDILISRDDLFGAWLPLRSDTVLKPALSCQTFLTL